MKGSMGVSGQLEQLEMKTEQWDSGKDGGEVCVCVCKARHTRKGILQSLA